MGSCKGDVAVDIDVGVDIDGYFGSLNGASKSVQVLLNCIQAVQLGRNMRRLHTLCSGILQHFSGW